MMRTPYFLVLSFLLVMLLPMRQVLAIEEAVSDVRILIDVSGSMKKNDPKNLRSPALEMVVGLLPEGANAGVWTFAKYVNMLVPHRDVDNEWRNQAEKQTTKIHSRGLFTNIEQVLNKATANQKKPDPSKRRSVILLSDGLVDIATDKAVSIESRQRILDKVVPRLKQAGVAVHTIALADGSDHELLRDIALATDGWYEQVDNAEQLQRVFLHLFEKAAGRDNVPLTKNHFKIDESVTEMTVLVFRQTDSKLTELVLPDRSRISKEQSAENVRWRHSESGYDLITVSEPQAGTWDIDAALDPDNRVMVVTDLKLKTTDLPNNILIGETFDFDASLTEKSEVITRQDFLKLVDAKVIHENELTDAIEHSLNDSQTQGVYRVQVGDTFQAGRNDVVTTMSSGTFDRQRRQSINVVEMPFAIDTEQLLDAETRSYRLTLKPDVSLVNEHSLSIAAMLTAEDGTEWSYDVMQTPEKEWQLTIADLAAEQQYTMNIQIKGETTKGRQLFLQPAPIMLVDETPLPQEELVPELTELEPVEEGTEEQIEPLMEPEVVDELEGDIDALLPEVETDVLGMPEHDQALGNNTAVATDTTKLMLGNIIIAILFAIAFLIWRRKAAATKNPGEQL